MMNTNEYVKYLTQLFVQYFDQPKSERKQHRLHKKQEKASLWFRWFGILPYAIALFWKSKRKEFTHVKNEIFKKN